MRHALFFDAALFLTVLLVLLVDRSWEDAPIALWTFISTSFALTIAAIIQVGKGSLSLFEALQVSNLVWSVHSHLWYCDPDRLSLGWQTLASSLRLRVIQGKRGTIASTLTNRRERIANRSSIMG